MNRRRAGRILIGASALISSIALIWVASCAIFARSAPKHVTIIYTNDTLGTLQPCGCHGTNSGGLPRRAKYIKSVISENPNTIVVESGNLAFSVNPAQPLAQLETVAKSLKAMNYTAVGVGPNDLFEFRNKFYDVLQKFGLPIVQTDGEEHPGAVPYLIKDLDGVKVGIVSFGAVLQDQKDSLALAKTRFQTLADVRQKCDVLVLLDQGKIATDEWLEKDAPRIGAPDIVVGGSAHLDIVEPKYIGKSMVVPTSVQGKYIGRVDLDLDGNNKKMTYYRQYIDPTIQEDSDVAQIVADYVKSQSVTPDSSASRATAVEPYLSYESCEGCHPAEAAQWKVTQHAGALKTLLTQQKAIPDCLPCHSEMYKKQKRLVINSQQLGGVECATCHSDVLPHTTGKKLDPALIKQKCAGCHTKEKSPGFDVEAAYEKVKHTQK